MNASAPVRPRAMQIDASSACQLRCPACPRTSGAIHPAVGTGMLRRDDLARLLDAAPEVRRVELSNYGEIFLNPELPGILRLCHERGVATTAFNDVNLNSARPEALEATVRWRMQAMTVAIDGATPTIYERYRVRGRLNRMLADIASPPSFAAEVRAATFDEDAPEPTCLSAVAGCP